jgi:hypothetical protein
VDTIYKKINMKPNKTDIKNLVLYWHDQNRHDHSKSMYSAYQSLGGKLTYKQIVNKG